MFADEDDLMGPGVPMRSTTAAVVSSASRNQEGSSGTQEGVQGAGSVLARSLTEKLLQGQYECAMCMSALSLGHQLWSCHNCYGVFHLTCTQSWARANPTVGVDAVQVASHGGIAPPPLAHAGKQFRCPTCRFQAASPNAYMCFCGSAREPRTNPALPPGSCGGICARRRNDASCPHKCSDVCHPGPCSNCNHKREVHCYCKKQSKKVGCSSGIDGYCCETVCGKTLGCGKHKCTIPCHEGPCPSCEEILSDVPCHCGSSSMERRCAKDTSFGCGLACPKKKSCGNHDCTKKCHPGDCDVCERDIKVVKSCACGQTPLWSLHHHNDDLKVRVQCTEPIPTCEKVCSKPLGCGQHFCADPCHDGPCKPCFELVKLVCQCGSCQSNNVRCFCSYIPQEQWRSISDREVFPKKELLKEYPWTCDRRCKVTKTCGRHKCENTCCGEGDEESHICFLECKKKASCGIHVCGQLCHKGMCPPCSNTSYESLYCRCRRSVLEPPVPCGTPPPTCNHPCSILRSCGHPTNHTCHPDSVECPPCVVSMEKTCGSHGITMDWHHACHLTPSCGKQCGKTLKCCARACVKPCHGGPCVHNCKKGLPELGTAYHGVANLEDELGAPPPRAGGDAPASQAPVKKKGKKSPWGN